MTAASANRLFLAGFVLVGIFYLYHSFTLATTNPAAGYGPVQLPIALGVFLILLCFAEFWVSRSKRNPEDDQPVEIANFGKLALTVLLTGIYYLAWSQTGQFYPATAIFFFILVMVYHQTRTPRFAARAAALAIVFAIALYLVFGLAFNVQLT